MCLSFGSQKQGQCDDALLRSTNTEKQLWKKKEMRYKRKPNAGILLKWLQFYKYNCVLSHAMSLDRPPGATVLQNNRWRANKRIHSMAPSCILPLMGQNLPKGRLFPHLSRLYYLHLLDSC